MKQRLLIAVSMITLGACISVGQAQSDSGITVETRSTAGAPTSAAQQAIRTQTSKKGEITAKMLQSFRQENTLSGPQQAIQNALADHAIKKLAINSRNRFKYDRDFTYSVTTKGITNQEQSGRCWLFTGLNVFRARVISDNDLTDFRFSPAYAFFFDQLEKSNLFLQGVIDHADKPMDDKMVEWLFEHPINDGGQYTGIADILSKYGVVPASVMPETSTSNSTSELRSILTYLLRQDGLALRAAYAKGERGDALTKMKTEQLSKIYHILCLTLGTPPESFEYTLRDKSGKVISSETYTPLSFFDKFVGDDLVGNYVMLMNDPSRPFYKLYEIDYDRHTYDGNNWRYINLPIEDIKEMAIASIKGNDAMYFSCDVGKELNLTDGTLDIHNYDYQDLLGIKMDMTKEQRIRTFASGSTHAMTLIAVDMDKSGQPSKWMVENSWGADKGYKGNLIMTDRWFNEYMFRLVVHKKYLTAKAKAILSTKPIMLPAWDPMFTPEQ